MGDSHCGTFRGITAMTDPCTNCNQGARRLAVAVAPRVRLPIPVFGGLR